METSQVTKSDAVLARTRRRGERGASLVEYALLVALIAIVCIASVAFFGGETDDTFSRVASTVEAT